MHLQRSFLALHALAALSNAVVAAPADRHTVHRVKGLFRAPPIQPGRPHVGRNEPCPCGSGKKFKSCHLTGRVSDVVTTTAKQLAVR